VATDVLTKYWAQSAGLMTTGVSSQQLHPKLHLFSGYTAAPNWNSVPTDFTECTAPGYAAVTLTPASWVGTVPGVTRLYTYPPFTITFTGPGSPGQTIYGHWVEDGSGAHQVIWGQLWAVPFVIPSVGGAVVISPTITLKQC
jgi:hypothetical protein